MKKIVRLTENDLMRLVKKVIKENKENDFNTVEGRIEILADRIKFDYSIFVDIEKIYKWIKDGKIGELSDKLKNLHQKMYSNFTDEEFEKIYKGLKRKMNNETDEDDEEGDEDRFVEITNELFPYKSLGLEHYEIFNKEDEDELEFELETGSLSKNDITNYLEYFFKEKFPNFEVHCGFYHGDKDIYINLSNDDETFGINLEYDLPSYNSDKYF